MSRSTGTTGSVPRHLRRSDIQRFTVRSLAVVLLTLSLAGGAQLTEIEPPDRTDAAAEALQHRAELDALRRLVEANERTDRGQRSPLQEAMENAEAEAEAAEQRVTRAEDAQTQPAEEPDASEGGGDSSSGPSEPAGPVPASCSEYSGNRATGCTLLLDAGFSLDQMSCLDNLWQKESGWNERAENPSSGAYGIPQALPGNKMASHGSDWQTNAATQISWGLDYIKDRYGTPCSAWEHSQATNWY